MSKSRRKGTSAEVAVVAALIEAGWPYAERRALAGNKDRGDIAGLPGVVCEVKNHREFDLGGWVHELEDEMVNDKADVGFVWAKRRGKAHPKDWYVITTGEVMMRLLRERDE